MVNYFPDTIQTRPPYLWPAHKGLFHSLDRSSLLQGSGSPGRFPVCGSSPLKPCSWRHLELRSKPVLHSVDAFLRVPNLIFRNKRMAMSWHTLVSSSGTWFCSMAAPGGRICWLIVGFNNIDDHPYFFNCVDYFQGHDVGETVLLLHKLWGILTCNCPAFARGRTYV